MHEMDEIDDINGSYRLTARGFARLITDDLEDLDIEDILFMRVCQSHEANEIAPPTDEDLTCVWKWYDRVMRGLSVLDMVLYGELYAVADRMQGDPVFSITPAGRRVYGEDEWQDDIEFM